MTNKEATILREAAAIKRSLNERLVDNTLEDEGIMLGDIVIGETDVDFDEVYFARRLGENQSGFGNTEEEALIDLLRKEGA